MLRSYEIEMVEKSKYKSSGEWKKADVNAYCRAIARGLLKEICEHFGWEIPKERKPSGYWTIEKSKEDALKFKTRNEWKENNKDSYSAAYRHKWITECCSHMKENVKPVGYWNFENCKEDALKYKYKKEWQNNSSSAYTIAHKSGWIEKCCEHMIRPKVHNLRWNFERCLEDAIQYKTPGEWQKKSGGAYNASRKNGWDNECHKHMIKSKRARKI